MTQLKLIKPSLDYEQQLIAYKAAFSEEHLYGGSRLSEYEDIAQWLQYIELASVKATCEQGRSPSSTFLCVRESDQKMVGICNIRHDLNQDFLLNIAGHIGYSILPSERSKGYGREQLRLALLKARELGIKKALVTCADWNKASEGVILANGGVYEDTRLDETDNDWMKCYWIPLS